eukprot:4578437-Pyramimonas_sp.AAC.1
MPRPLTPESLLPLRALNSHTPGLYLLEEVAGALQLVAPEAADEGGEVRLPDVLHVGVLEHRHALLVHLEGVLEELVLPQHVRVVQENLGRGDPELQDALVHLPRRVSQHI